MRLINSRDFIKTGEYICIENDEGKTLVRLYFSDYPSEQMCVEFSNKVLNLLKQKCSCYAVFNGEDDIIKLYQTKEKAFKELEEFQNEFPSTEFYVDTIHIN